MSGGGGEVGAGAQGDLIASLRARVAELEARLARVERERDEYRKLYLLVRQRRLASRHVEPPHSRLL